MKLTDWIFGAPKAAEKVLDGAISGIDKIFLTEEEKKDFLVKLGDTWIELQKLLGEETSIRGVTRRILAIMTTGTYILTTLAAAVVYKFDEKYASFLWEIANGYYAWITLTVVAFYFGPHFIGQMLNMKKPNG